MPNGFSGQKMQKKGVTQKVNHHQILHIWNSLDTKFQLKLTILNFLIKLTQKGYFCSKKKNHQIPHNVFLLKSAGPQTSTSL